VLADEPTANLDHATASRIIALMQRMQTEFQTTFVFSTHDTRIIGAVETIYTLEDGHLVGCERGKLS
jgi:putative ABC transport system ATP-binding protein